MFFDDEEFTGDGEERLVQSTKGEYDFEENVLRPKTLDAYVKFNIKGEKNMFQRLIQF